jgi:hypothetical protein
VTPDVLRRRGFLVAFLPMWVGQLPVKVDNIGGANEARYWSKFGTLANVGLKRLVSPPRFGVMTD